MILPTAVEAKGQLKIEVLTPSTDTARLAGEVVDSAAFRRYETDRQLMISRFGGELKNQAAATKLPDAQRVAILEQAAAFISRRYGELQIPIPAKIIYKGILQQDSSTRLRGVAYAPERYFDLEGPSGMSEARLLALAVHEVTHAIGHVAFQRRVLGGSADLVACGWGLFKSDSSSPLGTHRMFQVFEEGVAHHNERLSFVASGGKIEPTPRSVFLSSLSDPTHLRLFAINAEISERSGGRPFEEIINNSATVRVLQEAIREYGALELTYAGERLTFSGAKSKTMYNPLPAIFDELAKELYPQDPNSKERIIVELTKAQVTGDRRPFLTHLFETLGPGSVRFFALLHIRDQPNWRDDSLILSLYVRAGSLKKERRDSIRKELTRIVVQERSGHLGWTV